MIKIPFVNIPIYTRKLEQRKDSNIPSASFQMTPPISNDSFELNSSPLCNKNSLCPSNPLVGYVCNKYGISADSFKTKEKVQKYFEKELRKPAIPFEDNDNGCLSIEEMEQADWLQAKKESVENILSKLDDIESDPIKKFIYCKGFLDSNVKEWFILPYDKKIADEVFDEITNSDTKDINFYSAYRHKFLNQADAGLNAVQLGNGNTFEIDIQNKYTESVGGVEITSEFDVSGDNKTEIGKHNKKVYIASLGVEGQYRHSKMSKDALCLMFKKLYEYANENSCDIIELDVITNNESAVSGYIQKQGFQVVDFDICADVQKMEKSLKKNLLPNEEARRRRLQTQLFSEFVNFDKSVQEKLQKALFDSEVYKAISADEKLFLDKYTDSKISSQNT